MNQFFSTLFRNIYRSFTGWKFFMHILAILLTYVILSKGFDWYWFVHFGASSIENFFFPAVVIGAFVPIVVPIAVIIYGKVKRSKETTMTGWAIGQAAFIGSAISSTYKAFTGRMPPPHIGMVTDMSHGFQFGFLKHGIFWGWPSSHTTIAFAMAVTFCIMYKKNKLYCLLAMLYALYIGIGVSMNIHWFSEFAAGALIGTAIGLTVGRNWHKYTNR